MEPMAEIGGIEEENYNFSKTLGSTDKYFKPGTTRLSSTPLFEFSRNAPAAAKLRTSSW